jgi:hypothetical protein
MSTPDQFARRLGTLQQRLDKNVAGSVGRAALVLKTSVQANLISAIGPDYRMSGVGRRSTASRGGAKVGVRYDLKGTRNPTALLRMTGPAQLVERDTKPHTITARGRTVTVKGRRRRGASVMALGNGRFATSVSHPGTKGKKPFERGVERAAPAAQRILRGAVGQSMREVFK